jgi:hypothetical protein
VEHHWTVEEANAALPHVASEVSRLRRLLARLLEADAEERFAQARAETGGGYPGRVLATAWLELEMGAHALAARGVIVRDLERGLVDFPAVMDGEEVYLCWLHGEPRVAHWHHPETGFAGRRPL